MKLFFISLALLTSSVSFARTSKTCYGSNNEGKMIELFVRINRAELFENSSLVLKNVNNIFNQQGEECSFVENETSSKNFESFSNPCIKIAINKLNKTLTISDKYGEILNTYTNYFCIEKD